MIKKSRAKENNPNWKGGCYPKKCVGCGNTFTPKSHQEKTKFCSKKCSKTGMNNPQWKGDDVGYKSLHGWGNRNIDKPLNCQHCGKKKKLDLANKSGKYLRDKNDWIWLCRSCHMIMDGVTERLIDFGKKSRKYGEIICMYCNKKFLQSFKSQKFCSKPCSTTYYNKNTRVYKKNTKF